MASLSVRNIKLIIEYDGTNYSGWQRQANANSIQAEIERSLSNITQHNIKITTAGRTDAGVHALGQVANFMTHSRLPAATFQRGGNAVLPKDIRILSAEEVEPAFHARFSARLRSYRYVISKRLKAIGRQYSWHVSRDLDLAEMQDACRYIQGEADFQSFCQAGADTPHFLCKVTSAHWREDAEHLFFEISANRFLHNMVRILVGTFVNIGDGKLRSRDMKAIMEAKDRRAAGPTVPPHGLFLVRVDY